MIGIRERVRLPDFLSDFEVPPQVWIGKTH
jgi:hypothetical protein